MDCRQNNLWIQSQKINDKVLAKIGWLYKAFPRMTSYFNIEKIINKQMDFAIKLLDEHSQKQLSQLNGDYGIKAGSGIVRGGTPTDPVETECVVIRAPAQMTTHSVLTGSVGVPPRTIPLLALIP